MTGLGLAEVANPSAIFLAGRDATAPGAAVFAGMEGQRPMLIEIQALVAPTSLGTPRRAVVGFDQNRLSMILAVLEAHGGLKLGMHDVYLNVAGGLRADEPAGDLAAAAALVSSLTGAVLPADQAFFGEIGLSGAIRPVIHAGMRLREAGKLGFHQAVLAQGQQINEDERRSGLTLRPCADVAQLVAAIAQTAPRARGHD
jgi:DNA repair protein RadA/Sms